MKFNDMLAPDPIHLPEDPATGCDLLADATAVAHPDSPAVWAARAERELADGDTIVAYAYARTGYHRSLDRLRANGWKGWGPVPASHEANVPVLKAIAMLALTSKAIGDDAEYDRCRQMLSDADPDSVATLL
ncbi:MULTISPECIES: DUF3151 domain-containing protein [unclassified Corynebacterium]|uniref:DUF3151 domain-containing protein n=1 Tax=unclassified Corynebacterium TaxID=2624378 RepID=UPI0008A5F99A|nr:MULTISPECIES: DUF3151 domain-containing protein [unclassified Corynebacterium]MCQ4609686.1 DUF3151 domain-containing protein [Corynebacterium sp. CCUG 61414]MDK8243349.1 DUF3151 domain-containing protein [Corynebacterium sp. UMB10321]OFT31223.1 hypothetical protein HMPREF3170_03180 [Corynebacterium sp. HMSC08D02]WPJ92360.1 DUF3151 domain-containing protein [Corynebacterium sp. UMB2355A]